MCVLNHTSSARDVERVLDWFERTPLPLAAAEPPALPLTYDRDPPVATSWPNRRLGAGTPDLDGLRRLPLFQPLSEIELERIADLADERAVNPGEVIVEQYTRLATVTATSPMRLLVLTSADLLLLMNDMPRINAQVSRAVRDRLPGL